MKNMGEDIYYRCKIVLLGENILLENFSEFRVVGVLEHVMETSRHIPMIICLPDLKI